MADEDSLPDFITSNNQLRMYYELDKQVSQPPLYNISNNTDLQPQMHQALRADNDSFAIATARSLLENADLPLLLRARSCMVLACSEVPDFLEMAHEAVRIGELCNSKPEPGEREKKLLENCKSIRDQALKRFEDEKGRSGKVV